MVKYMDTYGNMGTRWVDSIQRRGSIFDGEQNWLIIILEKTFGMVPRWKSYPRTSFGQIKTTRKPNSPHYLKRVLIRTSPRTPLTSRSVPSVHPSTPTNSSRNNTAQHSLQKRFLCKWASTVLPRLWHRIRIRRRIASTTH